MNLDDDLASILSLLPGTAILVRNRITMDEYSRPVMFERGLYRVQYHLTWNGRSISNLYSGVS